MYANMKMSCLFHLGFGLKGKLCRKAATVYFFFKYFFKVHFMQLVPSINLNTSCSCDK